MSAMHTYEAEARTAVGTSAAPVVPVPISATESLATADEHIESSMAAVAIVRFTPPPPP